MQEILSPTGTADIYQSGSYVPCTLYTLFRLIYDLKFNSLLWRLFPQDKDISASSMDYFYYFVFCAPFVPTPWPCQPWAWTKMKTAPYQFLLVSFWMYHFSIRSHTMIIGQHLTIICFNTFPLNFTKKLNWIFLKYKHVSSHMSDCRDLKLFSICSKRASFSAASNSLVMSSSRRSLPLKNSCQEIGKVKEHSVD